MCMTFNSNLCTTIVSYYGPINANYEMDIITFYNELSSLTRHILKHNVLNIGEDMNAQITEDGNNKFCLHNLPNRNDEYRASFSLENKLTCLNTKF